ncbi:MAG: fluoride efflux transporter CrcB [Gammaproteobacteria bacterium]|nr:MAG: fluoride efflux transporter CrcB [Gammaproteobacteria bacterium]
MQQLISIGIGGAIGAILRYLVSGGVHTFMGKDFPYGTLSVNVIGSFVVGVLFVIFATNDTIPELLKISVLVGMLGAFTTFSTFSLDTFKLIETAAFSKAGVNIAINVVASIAATWFGIVCSRVVVQG